MKRLPPRARMTQSIGVEVYFDDFSVTQAKGPIVQLDDYYPFGLAFNSYRRENTVSKDFLYNGKELQTDLDLGWLDDGARMYMPEIGRWGVVDPLADKAAAWSVYIYAFNCPLRFIDPTGMKNEDANKEKKDEGGFQFVKGGYGESILVGGGMESDAQTYNTNGEKTYSTKTVDPSGKVSYKRGQTQQDIQTDRIAIAARSVDLSKSPDEVFRSLVTLFSLLYHNGRVVHNERGEFHDFKKILTGIDWDGSADPNILVSDVMETSEGVLFQWTIPDIYGFVHGKSIPQPTKYVDHYTVHDARGFWIEFRSERLFGRGPVTDYMRINVLSFRDKSIFTFKIFGESAIREYGKIMLNDFMTREPNPHN